MIVRCLFNNEAGEKSYYEVSSKSPSNSMKSVETNCGFFRLLNKHLYNGNCIPIYYLTKHKSIDDFEGVVISDGQIELI